MGPALGLLVVGGIGLVLGLLADRTEVGARLAEAVRGRPYRSEET